jgi:energy-coupling factor transporter ATP-binding protein EcfA2
MSAMSTRRDTVGHHGTAERHIRRTPWRRLAHSRGQRLRQVDAGVDHGRVDGADVRRLPAERWPVTEQLGVVALSFQATRLQLMRGRVGEEIASAAGFSAHTPRGSHRHWGAVGLDAALADRAVDQLSGGQMRRVVLAGMLARAPRVLFLDEPLAGLDAASQQGLLRSSKIFAGMLG